jgi:hypothetical protein
MIAFGANHCFCLLGASKLPLRCAYGGGGRRKYETHDGTTGYVAARQLAARCPPVRFPPPLRRISLSVVTQRWQRASCSKVFKVASDGLRNCCALGHLYTDARCPSACTDPVRRIPTHPTAFAVVIVYAFAWLFFSPDDIRLGRRDVKKKIPQYVNRHYAAFSNRHQEVSLDQPLPGIKFDFSHRKIGNNFITDMRSCSGVDWLIPATLRTSEAMPALVATRRQSQRY